MGIWVHVTYYNFVQQSLVLILVSAGKIIKES